MNFVIPLCRDVLGMVKGEINTIIDYETINGISLEGRQKLNKFKPRSIGQASRISGVSPADVSVLDRVNVVFKPQSENGSGITETEGYRYFDFETLEFLGMKNMQQEFFVNIKKRTIISTEGIKNKGMMCYTLEQLPDGLYNVEYTPLLNDPVDFDINGKYLSDGKGRIDIFNITYNGPINKWQVRYRIKGEEKWKNKGGFTGNETEIEVDKVGVYEVQVYHGGEAISDIKEVII